MIKSSDKRLEHVVIGSHSNHTAFKNVTQHFVKTYEHILEVTLTDGMQWRLTKANKTCIFYAVSASLVQQKECIRLQVLDLCIKGKYFSSREVSLTLLAARALMILTSLFGIETKLCQISRIEVSCQTSRNSMF